MEERKMVQVNLKDGVLEVPEDFIILNPEVAQNSTKAWVRECRNSAAYDIPHFVYLVEEGKEIWNEDTTEEISKLCCEKWPKFKEVVLDKQVVGVEWNREKGIIYDTATGKDVTEEWEKAPNIGDFPVKRNDDVDSPIEPPYGVYIIPGTDNSQNISR